MDTIKTKIDDLFNELGFKLLYLNNNNLYFLNNHYYRIDYIADLESYVIEYAYNYDDAMKNLFEDGDLYPVSLGEENLLCKMRKDLLKYYMT